jgi:hypothetical protein
MTKQPPAPIPVCDAETWHVQFRWDTVDHVVMHPNPEAAIEAACVLLMMVLCFRYWNRTTHRFNRPHGDCPYLCHVGERKTLTVSRDVIVDRVDPFALAWAAVGEVSRAMRIDERISEPSP